MRSFLIVSAIVLLGMTQAAAQEYEYVPFVREGVKWVCAYPVQLANYDIVECFFTLEFQGEKIINGKTYKAMHKYCGDVINWQDDTIPMYMREEDKVVYGIVPDGKTYSDCPVGIQFDTNMQEKIANGEEFVLYDFRNPEEFIKGFVLPDYMKSYYIHDMVTVGERQAQRYIFQHWGRDVCAVEGIGYDGFKIAYPLGIYSNEFNDFSYDSMRFLRLSKVLDHGETVYQSEHYKWYRDPDEYLVIPREGVYWVYQDVTVNGNDTTYNYYTFEFKGTNFRQNPSLYYCPGDTPDGSGWPVAVFEQRGYDQVNFRYNVSVTEPLQQIIDEGRCLMRYSTYYPMTELYQFHDSGSDICYNYPINYYIYCQKGNWLSKENFIELEPIVIEDKPCRRYAYYDEEGEPRFYIVEGIGFDSRDMGDLLTPFTQRPDPDAEHQEWCGLSHVVKDGKIIYKGMCYDPVKFGDLNYDVNSDGVVNITDVTILISMLIGNNTPVLHSSANGDVNSDGYVNITDVTTLINYVLTR